MRRTRYKHMNMISSYMPLYDLHFHLGTNIPHDLPQSCCNISSQQMLPVRCDPHQMILDIKPGMRRPSIMLHTRSYYKLSPEGEGFKIPKRDY